MSKKQLQKRDIKDRRRAEISNPGLGRVLLGVAAQVSPFTAVPNAIATALETRHANKKLQKFLSDVEEKFLDIEGDMNRVRDRLENCEGFPALYVRIIEEVNRTADKDKIELLRRATINLTYSDIEISELEQLTKILTDLTAIDVNVLQFFSDIDWENFDEKLAAAKMLDREGAIGKNHLHGKEGANLFLGHGITMLGLNKNFVPLSIRKLVQFELLGEMGYGAGRIINGQLALPMSKVTVLGKAILDLLTQVHPSEAAS